MTEPMKTPDEILKRCSPQGDEYTKVEIIAAMREYATQQVAAERERIKKLAKETRDEETNSIWIPQLFEIIDSL